LVSERDDGKTIETLNDFVKVTDNERVNDCEGIRADEPVNEPDGVNDIESMNDLDGLNGIDTEKEFDEMKGSVHNIRGDRVRAGAAVAVRVGAGDRAGQFPG
jgi:hypothetical protein